MSNEMSNLKTNRRQFLVGSASAGMFLAVAPLSACNNQGGNVAEMAQDFEPTIWSIIAPDGKITVNCAKAEMGQHVGTGLARILADELEANWDDVEVVHVDTDPKWGTMLTGGSWSIHQTFDLMSRAGAAGRIAMIEAGAAMMDVAAMSCSARDSRVISGDKSVSYAEIVSSGTANRSFTDEEMGAITLKSPADYRLIGKDTKALDIPNKIDGSAKYGIDVTKEGMVYARPIVPPTRFGSSVKSFDDTAAKEIPGYIQTVELSDPSETCQGWLAVVAENYPAAIQAADAVLVEWNSGPGIEISEADLQAESRRLIADPDAGSLFINEGDVDDAMNGATTVIENEFTTSTVLHFPLEPMNAVAYQEDGKWHFHSGTQWQSLTMPMITKAMGVTEAELIIHTYQLGGG
ncbi:MAG: molybdopterin-dependent oxidoreductase, partial [Emcibacteraceae bacterium]|nr:molybdopterin-dependent oxidoreductase [Emcibacteraceae bacterium]